LCHLGHRGSVRGDVGVGQPDAAVGRWGFQPRIAALEGDQDAAGSQRGQQPDRDVAADRVDHQVGVPNDGLHRLVGVVDYFGGAQRGDKVMVAGRGDTDHLGACCRRELYGEVADPATATGYTPAPNCSWQVDTQPYRLSQRYSLNERRLHW
jgi:hypothetical protein